MVTRKSAVEVRDSSGAGIGSSSSSVRRLIVPTYLSSAQEHNNWFPSSLSAHETLNQRPSDLRAPHVSSNEEVLRQALSDGWANGTRLSELLATILSDRSQTKQIEVADSFGRVLSQRKLLLVGTEAVVKSKAQAIHNLRLCLQCLRAVPNFPAIGSSAFELFESPNEELQQLVTTICDAFCLPALSVRSDEPVRLGRYRRLLVSRSNSQSHSRSRSRSRTPSRSHSRSQSAHRRPEAPAYSSSASASHSPARSRNRARSQSQSQSPSRSVSPLLRARKEEVLQRNASRLRSLQGLKGLALTNDCQERLRQMHIEQEHARVRPQEESYFRRLSTPPRWKAAREVEDDDVAFAADERARLRKRAVSSEKRHQARLQQQQTHRSRGGMSRATTAIGSIGAEDSSSLSLSLSQSVRKREMQRDRLVAQRHARKELQRVHERQRALPQKLMSVEEIEQQLHSQQRSGNDADAHREDSSDGANAHGDAFNVKGYTRKESTGSNSQRRGRPREREIYWAAPSVTASEREAVQQVTIPVVTSAQQRAVRQWLHSLGLSVLDGEAGSVATDLEMDPAQLSKCKSITPLPLSEDRLRNGVFLTLLFAILEPDVTQNTHVLQLLRRAPQTIDGAMENLLRVLWLFRVKSCPPLPKHLLSQPELILKGDTGVIWGLLVEIMQLYSQSSTQQRQFASRSRSPYKRFIGASGSESMHDMAMANAHNTEMRRHQTQGRDGLFYSTDQRRALDVSLCEWLASEPVLATFMHSIPLNRNGSPSTILALESMFRDGTLLCVLCEEVLGVSLPQRPHSTPHTYSQCLHNVDKCIKALQSCRSMSTRFLYHGVVEDIVRGKWDSILGLLEDMRIFCDRLRDWRYTGAFVPNKAALEGVVERELCDANAAVLPQVFPEYPYLGRKSLKKDHQRSSATRPSKSTSMAATVPDWVTSCIDSDSHPAADAAAPGKVSLSAKLMAVHDFDGGPRLSLRNSLNPDIGVAESSYHPTDIQSNQNILPHRSMDVNANQDVSISNPDDLGRLSRKNDPVLVDRENESQSLSASLVEALSIEDSDDDVDVDVSSVPTSSDITHPDYFEDSLLKIVSSPSDKSPAGDALLKTILDWLTKHDLKVVLQPSNIANSSASQQTTKNQQIAQLGALFADGVLLARLTQKLERATISGLHLKPSNAAQRLQNVRRSLELLAQRNKRLSLRALAVEEEVLQGDGFAVLTLLDNIRKAYAGHVA